MKKYNSLCCLILVLLPFVSFTQSIVTNNSNSEVGSLRYIITNATAGDTITFDSSLSGATITLTTGVITISKDLTIDGSALTDQVTISGNDASAIFFVTSGSKFSLDALTIRDGAGGNGGAINVNNSGKLTINNSTFIDNSSTFEGGAIRVSGGTTSLTITGSTFSGNKSVTQGGAISIATGVATIVNTTFSGNIGGGGLDGTLYTTGSVELTVDHVTLVNNISGLYMRTNSTAHITNSIIANNSSYDVFMLTGATITTNENSLCKSCSNGEFAIEGEDPLLNDLADNGGVTQTHSLQKFSPAINTAVAVTGSLQTDQQGVSRSIDGAPDMGAFEAMPFPPLVSTLFPSDDADNASYLDDLVITFDEPVVKGTGTIQIFDASNILFESIPVNDARVTITDAVVTINPTNDLLQNTSYYVQLGSTVFDDATGSDFAGITTKTDWDFTTINVELVFDKDSICVGEEVTIGNTALGYLAGTTVTIEVEDSTYQSDFINHTFTTTGFVDVMLTIKNSTGITTIIDSVYVQGVSGLSSYDILYISSFDTTNHVVGQENTVFSCGVLDAYFSSTDDLTVYWESSTAGNDYTIVGQDMVYFDVWDQYELCTTRDSVTIEQNNTAVGAFFSQLNTYNASDQVYIRWDDFQEVTSATINDDLSTLLENTTVDVLTELDEDGELSYILEYAADESVTGFGQIVVTLQDVCGATKDVFYRFESVYQEPLVMIDTITLEVGESHLLNKDSISVQLNTGSTREITLLDESFYASFLRVSLDVSATDVHRGISIVARDEFPDFVGEDTVIYVNYKICEVENNVKITCEIPDRIPVRLVKNTLVLPTTPIELEDGVLNAQGLGLTNKQIKDSLEIIVLNSAVSNNVGLSFEFRWNGKLIDADSLQYELTIVSRWNDVVYQASGSGEYPEWYGDNKPLDNTIDLTEKVSKGNYFWMISIDYTNEKGNNKKYYKHGYLYYEPIYESNQ